MSNPAQQPVPPPNPIVARALWDYTGERLRFVSQIQADYGKWLLVTITTVHLATVYMVSQPTVPVAVRTNPSSYWPSITGVCLVLTAGLATWANWALAANLFAGWMDANMHISYASWPKPRSKFFNGCMAATFYAPIIFGLASAFCIPWAAHNAMAALAPAALATPHVSPARTALPAGRLQPVGKNEKR